MTKANTHKLTPGQKQEQAEAVEITFDFARIDLMDLLAAVEFSAETGAGVVSANDGARFANFLRVMRTAFVRSSRPLTGEDFSILRDSFWKQYRLVRDPNS